MIDWLVPVYMVGCVASAALLYAAMRPHGGLRSTGTSRHALLYEMVSLAAVVVWPIGLARWRQVRDRLIALRAADAAARVPEREYTEAEYVAAEKITDRTAGGYILLAFASAFVALGLSSATGLDEGVAALLVMVPAIGAYFAWSARRTKDLPPQRHAVRPIRVRWLLKGLLLTVRPLLLFLIVIALAG